MVGVRARVGILFYNMVRITTLVNLGHIVLFCLNLIRNIFKLVSGHNMNINLKFELTSSNLSQI